jgi:hypothetical protein
MHLTDPFIVVLTDSNTITLFLFMWGVIRMCAINLIAKLELLVISHGNNASNSLKLANLLWQFCAHLHHKDALNSKQTT